MLLSVSVPKYAKLTPQWHCTRLNREDSTSERSSVMNYTCLWLNASSSSLEYFSVVVSGGMVTIEFHVGKRH